MLLEDLGLYRSLTVSEDSTNGGRMSATLITSGVSRNIWEPVFAAERAVESEYLRKVFFKCNDSDNDTGYTPKIFYYNVQDGDEWAVFWAGTQRDTAADITGSERIYTAGLLASGVSAGAYTLTLTVKDAAQTAGFADGDTVIITSKATPTSTTGYEQELTVNATPSVSGLNVTITFDEALLYDFAAGVVVSSVYEPDDVECSVSGTSYTGGANIDFDLIELGNVGTTSEDYVGTMTDATHYTIEGDSLGTIGSSDTSTDYEPDNPDWSSPRFTLPALAFDSLTLAADDTFSFTTNPASVPIWEERVNPVDAENVSSSIYLVCRVETV